MVQTSYRCQLTDFIVLTVLVILIFISGTATAAITFRSSAQNGIPAVTPPAVAYEGAGTAATLNGCGTINPTSPAGNNGDILIALVLAKEFSTTITFSAGWNAYLSGNYGASPNNEMQRFIYWRIADGTASDNFSVTQSGTCSNIGAQIARFSGIDQADPFETASGGVVNQDSGDLDTGTIVTTDPDAMLLVAGFVSDDRTVTEGFGWSQSFDFTSNQGGAQPDLGLSLHYQLQTTAGTKGGTLNWDLSGFGTDENTGVAFALSPDPGATAGLTISVPAGTTTDDVMVAVVAVRPSTITITPPAGWTSLNRVNQTAGNSNGQEIFYRVATGSEPVSYTWTFTGTITGAAGGISTYTGVETSSPINVFGGNITASGTTHTANSITTTETDTMVVSSHSYSSSEFWTPPGGMTERVDVASETQPNGGGIALEMNDVTQASAGATGNKTATAAGSADTGVAQIIALRPLVRRMHVVLPGQTFVNGVGALGTATDQTAGTAFNLVQLVLTDGTDNPDTTYSGSKTISYSGPGSSGGSSPLYTTAVNFTNGVSTTTLTTTLYRAETTTITALDTSSTVITGVTSSSFTVNPDTSLMYTVLPGETFTANTGITGTPTDQVINVAFNLTSLVVADQYFNVITGFASGPHTITYTGPGGSPSYTTSVSFTGGISTTTLATTLDTAETTTITASGGGVSGVASSSFTVATAPVSPGTITVTFSSGVSSFEMGAVYLSGTVTGDPEDASSQTSTGGPNSLTTSVTSTANAWLVDVASNGDNGSYTQAGSQVERWDLSAGANGSTGVMSTDADVSAGSNSMTQNHSDGTINRFVHSVVSIAPDGGIAYDSVSSTSGTGNTVVSWTHTFNGSSSGKLIVGISAETNNCPTVVSVVFDDGTAMPLTQIPGTVNNVDNGFCNQAEMWYLDIDNEPPPPPEVRASYRFDEDSWTGAVDEVLDSSGNGLHGAAIGGAVTANLNPVISGSPGTCRYGSFDGASDYVQVDDDALLDIDEELTVAVWINPSSWPGSDLMTIISKDDNFEFHLNPSGQVYWWWGGGALELTSSGTIDTSDTSGPYGNGWHHVAIVYSSSGALQQIFINGVADANTNNQSGTLTVNTEPFQVGADVGPDRFFDGQMDEVRVYQGALGSSEINTVMNESRTCDTSTLLYYQMDESSWVSAGDVEDSSGNSLDGTPNNGVTPVPTPIDQPITGDPGTCGYGSFDGVDDYIEVVGFPDVTTGFSIAAWVRTQDNTQTGQRIFVDDDNDNGYGLSIGDAGTGTVRFFSRGVSSENLDTGNVIMNNTWYFIVVTVDIGSSEREILVYNTSGTLMTSVNDTYTGSIGTDAGPASIGGESDSGDTNSRFNGELDEVRFFEGILSSSEIIDLINETHACGFTPVLVGNWQLDETSWNGFTDEVTDSSGNDLHGVSVNGTDTDNTNPVITGDPGTCRYGDFVGSSDQYVQIDDSPLLDVSNELTVSAWINPDSLPGGDLMTIVSKDLNYEFHLKPSGVVNWWWNDDGGNTREFDSTDTISTSNFSGPFGNGWHHVAVVYTHSEQIIYVDGNPNSNPTPYTDEDLQTTNAVLFIGVDLAFPSRSFDGQIDEVRIYKNKALSASEINVLMNETHPCTIVTADHYSISFPNGSTGTACELPVVEITAHDSSDGVIEVPAGTSMSFDTSTGLGVWGPSAPNPLSGSGIWTPSGADDGSATYVWPGSESSVQVELSHSTATGVNINISDGTAADPGDGGAEDPSLDFTQDPIIRITSDGNSASTINTQIAGKDSDQAPAQTLYIQLKQSGVTVGGRDGCEVPGEYSGTTSVTVALECINPDTCSGEQVSINGSSVSAAHHYDSGTVPATLVGTGINFTFDGSGDVDDDNKAQLVFNFPDSGQVKLHFTVTMDPSGPPPVTPSRTFTGVSNAFVVRPFGYSLESSDPNISAIDASGTAFKKAGTGTGADFDLDLRAVVWEASDDTDSDGIPDPGAALAANAVTPNFGNEITHVSADVTHTLALPAGGVTGSLIGGADVDGFNNDGGDTDSNNSNLNQGETTVTLSFDEVGIINLTASTIDYLGATDADIEGSLTNVGRFYPDRFDVAGNSPLLLDSCNSGSFTYLDQNFYFDTAPILTITALNTDGDTTENYGGDFWKLTSTLPSRSYSDQVGGTDHTFAGTAGPAAVLNGDTDYDGIGTLGLTSGSSGEIMRYGRVNPEAPFAADINLEFTVSDLTDSDTALVCYDATDDGACDSFTISNMSGANMRFGRLVIAEEVSSEELPIVNAPLTAEYYDGSGYIVNTDDVCTGLAVNEIVLSNTYESGQTDGDIQICETGMTDDTTMTVANNPFVLGDAQLTFTAPGSGCTGFAGISVDLTSLGLDHLLFDWDGEDQPEGVPDGILYDDDPTGRATFGVISRPKQIIYTREPWN